jgi:hypothetical protein
LRNLIFSASFVSAQEICSWSAGHRGHEHAGAVFSITQVIPAPGSPSACTGRGGLISPTVAQWSSVLLPPFQGIRRPRFTSFLFDQELLQIDQNCLYEISTIEKFFSIRIQRY